ncbi:hypothetical protein [Gorillibacterium massiliense]|uniref:hypothetical protein n=1 Tax=Gorillibacterium massiliense TaxID=1280390 RepID=UPI0005940F71|nr:hypothetical protein [Gorillibacterium massiliense]
MTDLRLMRKHYAVGVIDQLQNLGYSEEEAKIIFLRHYRNLKRSFGLNMNVHDFAKTIDELERAINRKDQQLDDPTHVYVVNTRDQLKKNDKRVDKSNNVFRISEKMEQKIKEWDSCVPIDVTGAKLAYIFIPTELGLIIKVRCDVCKRELLLSDL